MKKFFKFAILFVFFLTKNNDVQRYDKCIVVTTINYPTQALRKLSQLPDWRLIVVADKKTPTDWYLENCDLLSVSVQEQLPYKIIRYLPWNHYSRKNIGYLYAIEHGAKVIYETDDDNILLNDTIFYLKEYDKTLCYSSDAIVANPYEYFGKPNVWPRGYPLSKITEHGTYQLHEDYSKNLIQQGVVNNDPDVDAIFRLTHKKVINFNSNDPISLLPKVMAPFNSQNTLFHRDAFWGLLLPVTTSFRVCDIWRGYWVQRILWDIKGSLCFLPPTAVQYRNDHDLLKDFGDELDLYLHTESLITTLVEWKSNTSSLEQHILELFKELINKKYFQDSEILLLHAWIEDLNDLQYTMPNIEVLL